MRAITPTPSAKARETALVSSRVMGTPMSNMSDRSTTRRPDFPALHWQHYLRWSSRGRREALVPVMTAQSWRPLPVDRCPLQRIARRLSQRSNVRSGAPGSLVGMALMLHPGGANARHRPRDRHTDRRSSHTRPRRRRLPDARRHRRGAQGGPLDGEPTALRQGTRKPEPGPRSSEERSTRHLTDGALTVASVVTRPLGRTRP